MTIATFHFAAQASRLKYAIAPSASVTATGDSTIGIDGSVWTVVGAAGSETSDWVLSAQTKDSCVVTAPSGTNKACILQRLVTTTVNGRTSQIASTAKIFSGVETICPGETYESDQSAGWSPLVNAGLISGGGVLPEVTFDGKVSLSSFGRAEFDDAAADCVLGLPAQPFTPGAEYELTIVNATDLVYPPALDPEGSWDAFAVPYFIAVTATSESTFTSIGKAQTSPNTTTPTISGLTVDAGDLDKLIVPASVACHFPLGALTGVSLGGTMAIARTVSSVFAGNGTNSITLDLSGDLNTSDTPSLVLASNRELCSMESGVKVAAGSYAISFTGTEYDWSGVASLWLRADQGIGVADEAALSSGWTSINPPSNYVLTEATNRPTYEATTPGNLRPGVDFDGTNDLLTANMTIQQALGATSTSYCIVAAVQVRTVTSTSGTSSYDNVAIFQDSGFVHIGLHLTFSGGQYHLVALNYDTSPAAIYASVAIGASLPTNGLLVCYMRLSGGNLYVGYHNGTTFVESTAAPSAGLNSAANTLFVRLGRSASAKYFDGIIQEFVCIQSGTRPDTGIAAMAGTYL